MYQMAQVNDAVTRHQIYILRYGNGLFKDLVPYLEKAIKVAKLALFDLGDGYSQELRIKQLQDDLSAIYKEMHDRGIDLFSSFANYEASFNEKLLNQETKPDVGVQSANVDDIATRPLKLEVGQGTQSINITGALQSLGIKQSADIISEIHLGSANDENINDIAKRIDDGVTKYKQQLQSVALTLTNHVATEARLDTFKANSDILDGWRWVSTLDSRTSAICQARDQEILPLDSPIKPPAHYRCRSTLVPVIKKQYAVDVDFKRPAVGVDGTQQVSAKTSYQDWLAKQPSSFQKDVLGPTRAKLFKDGNLTLDKFIDSDGNTLTLDELKQKEPQAFKRAGLAN